MTTADPWRAGSARSGPESWLLLWYPDIDLVELSLQDRATGGRFHIEVAPEDAIDAFYHPYAYASACDVHRDDENEGTINDA
jgi:hypothetical protein